MRPFRPCVDRSSSAGPALNFRYPLPYRPPSPPRRRSSPVNDYDVACPPSPRKITPPERDFPTTVPPAKYTAKEIASWSTARPPPMKPDGLSYRFPLDSAEFSGPEKIPDFELQAKGADLVSETVFVVEMGFSQAYQSLREDVAEWFRGTPSMIMVVLVNVIESPRYRNPLTAVGAQEIVARLEGVERREALEPMAGIPWGGIKLRGLVFVGALEGYMEMWVRGPNGPPQMRGPRLDFIPRREGERPLEFRLGEFSARTDVQEVVVPLWWDDLRDNVWEGAQELAVYRARAVLTEARKAEGHQDSDYTPSEGDHNE
ncbi:MAG: hypothetical protein M1826_004054 [Phylliscum demangeonii]|nr:MAG: hypothetical protein M1826_004054 [Phylliscum demangeonii]